MRDHPKHTSAPSPHGGAVKSYVRSRQGCSLTWHRGDGSEQRSRQADPLVMAGFSHPLPHTSCTSSLRQTPQPTRGLGPQRSSTAAFDQSGTRRLKANDMPPEIQLITLHYRLQHLMSSTVVF